MAHEFIAKNGIVSQGNIVISGSITTTGAITVSGSIASASYALSASYASSSTSASYAVSSSYALDSTLHNGTASAVFATTGSNNLVGDQHITSVADASAFAATASLYTDGGLQVAKNAYFSSSMFIKGNLTIYGTQSVAYITSSQLNISTNVITVNTATPSVRFGGLSVYDSGSTGTGATGSIFWDSQNNNWIYSRESGSTYAGGMLISGPRLLSGSAMGTEQGTTACMVMVGQGGDHITSSLIYHDSTVTCIPNTFIGSTTCTTMANASCIGIGTTTPSTPLEIYAATGNQLKISTNDATSANNAGIFFYNEASATSSTRRSYILLDPNGANGSGGDYAYFDMYGSGTVRLMNQLTAGTLALGVGGSNILNITGSSVGIGTSSPGAKLEVVGVDENLLKLKNGSGQPALVRFNDTSTTADPYIGSYGNSLAFGIYGVGEAMRIDSSRNVGIRTDAPFSLLHVGTRPGAGTTNPSLCSIATISNDGLTGIDLGGNVNANNVVGHINWVNYLGVGNYNTARIDVYANGAGNSGDLRFWTATVASSPTIRLTIASTGAATFSSSVSIGGADQGYQLDVKRTSTGDATFDTVANFYKASTHNTGLLLRLKNTIVDLAANNITGGGGPSAGMSFSVSSGGTISTALTISSTGAATFCSSVTVNSDLISLAYRGTTAYNYYDLNGAGAHRFRDNNGNNNLVSILNSGNVGIGTTGPNNKLTVWTPSTTGLQTALRLNNPFGFTDINTGAKIVFSQDRSTAENLPMGEMGVGQEAGGTSDYGYMFFSTLNGTIGERMRISASGGLGIGTTSISGTTRLRAINSSAVNGCPLFFSDNNVYNAIGIYSAGADGYNGAATVQIMGRNTSTSRSINAGGTINASGADYAEYMTKAVTDTIAKGDIVGINSNGLLTNVFADSISFAVKSTDPSYVGGDTWGSVDIIGKLDPEASEEEKAEHNDKLEEARAKVDRIAFSGQVPCNVTGATVGDYIIPIQLENGKISGQAITNPTLEQYQISVGKVWKIMENGKAWIAVKIG